MKSTLAGGFSTEIKEFVRALSRFHQAKAEFLITTLPPHSSSLVEDI